MNVLYTGLTPPKDPSIFHCPFIQIEPLEVENSLKPALAKATHLIFTSKTAAHLFFSLPFTKSALSLPCYAVGESTKKTLQDLGVQSIKTSKVETAEGLVDLLDKEKIDTPYFIWPHSSLSRPVISEFLSQAGWDHYEFALYHTAHRTPKPLPPLEQFDEVVFTSPSTVDSFFHAYGFFPDHIQLTSIGPVTAKRLSDLQRS